MIEEPGGGEPHLLRQYRVLEKPLQNSYRDWIQLQIVISDPETRQPLIEILVFKNANTECKGVIGSLKAQGTPV